MILSKMTSRIRNLLNQLDNAPEISDEKEWGEIEWKIRDIIREEYEKNPKSFQKNSKIR